MAVGGRRCQSQSRQLHQGGAGQCNDAARSAEDKARYSDSTDAFYILLSSRSFYTLLPLSQFPLFEASVLIFAFSFTELSPAPTAFSAGSGGVMGIRQYGKSSSELLAYCLTSDYLINF